VTSASVLAVELRAERARLIRAQRGLASTINGYYPRSPGQPRPLGEVQACEQAEQNAARIVEIDKDLETLSEVIA
jgi:hypothetical protein